MPKETSYQKVKRQLIEMERKLALVCTDPESNDAQSIIMNYKILKEQSKMLFYGSYVDKLKGMGLLDQITTIEPYVHFEENMK
jgi:hypothetical protein